MVAFDHRSSLRRDLRLIGHEATAAQRVELKNLVWQGVAEALPELPARARAAILVDRGHRRIMTEAAQAGVTVAIALEASGADELTPAAAPHELAAELRRLDAGFGKILLRWNPADGDGRKRRQLAQLQQLEELTRRSGAGLLLELLIPPRPEDLAGLSPGDRWDEALLPRRQHEAVSELLDAGVAPALWKLEGHPDTQAARAVAELLGGCDPPTSVLVLGGGAHVADLGRLFAGGAGIDLFGGFAVGRSIWWEPVMQLCVGAISEEGARRAVGRNYLAVIDAYEAAASRD
jgi:5-dehydro-2-deoxygluconokinase